MRRRRVWILHPFFFAIFPVLSLLSGNINRTPITEAFLPAGVSLLFTLLFWLLLVAMLRSKQKAAVIVSLFLLLFFSYGHFYDLINRLFPVIWGLSPGQHRLLLPLWGVLFLLGAGFTVVNKKPLGKLTFLLNIVAGCLVGMSVLGIGAYSLRVGLDRAHAELTQTVDLPAADNEQPKPLRDIYYIILDRYADASTFKNIYGYDNTEFIRYLEAKGFYVAQESRANYPRTKHSLSSSLNMTQVNYLTEVLGENCDDFLPLQLMLQDPQVWHFLKQRGYRFIYFGSWAQATRRNKYADVNINLFGLPEFTHNLYCKTMLYPVGLKHFYNERRIQHARVKYKLDKLAEVPRMEGPKFVFVHLIIPHRPYVFAPNGDFVPYNEAAAKGLARSYLDQVAFLNKELRALVDTLLARSAVPPVVILQGDEGPNVARLSNEQRQNFNWERASRTQLLQKMSILNAYYLPGVETVPLYPSITPVNSFRLVFNLYFNTDFELLPDKSYVFPDSRHPYVFVDVTEKLKGGYSASPGTKDEAAAQSRAAPDGT